ncbi:hypothetical protein DNU06_06815 [Putridiphycobacter roseus]|uniref:DUF1269 domain-containing protein n=1 Tax=Putridiphycobacter roseus TaxID=2219161 RepID=A0A2W1NEK7_9FLAO|nr:DUF1269 domain-containing protein [Putridiphycobacter roseus]PZE17533.1 hypothetical protein DNU06_06815 [Putridiphycobacter roseus]
MANIIVVSFKEEGKAIEALHKMKELDAYGDITLYDHMIIRKKANDDFDILEDKAEGPIWRTFTGMALGGLVGAIAGPIGFVVGMISGTAAGAMLDVSEYDMEDEFVKEVTNSMKVGDITIISEVGENSSIYIDEYLKGFNVDVFRTDEDEEFYNYIDEQIEDFEDDIEDLRDELKDATATEKVKINAKITELKAKRKAKIAELEAKRKADVELLKEKTKNRIKKLEARLHRYKDAVANTINATRKNRLIKKIKKEEEKLNRLHDALGEDIID